MLEEIAKQWRIYLNPEMDSGFRLRVHYFNEKHTTSVIDSCPGNPELMTAYCQQLGMRAPFQFYDVLGTDADLLAMVPGPTLALLLLFPCSEQVRASSLL